MLRIGVQFEIKAVSFRLNVLERCVSVDFTVGDHWFAIERWGALMAY